MNPIATSILLGLTAAAANVFGGAIIVQRHWERRYLRYFVALGAGFMLATALVEMVPESIELRGRSAAFLVLLGYLIIHFFEHTVTPALPLRRRNASRRVHPLAQELLGADRTHHSHVLRRHRHRFRISGFELAGMADFPRDLSAQNSRRLHRELGHAGQRTQPRHGLGRVRRSWEDQLWLEF